MRRVLLTAGASLTLSGCILDIDESKPPIPGTVKLAGHRYWTLPNCKRHMPLNRWDNDCDVPYVGLGPGWAQSGDHFAAP